MIFRDTTNVFYKIFTNKKLIILNLKKKEMKFHNMICKIQVIVVILFGACDWILARRSGNRYLEHLFLKYGSQDVITFEVSAK